MKFEPHIKAKRRPVTGRRLAAARRSIQRQTEAVSLFPELAPAETSEERIDRLDNENVAMVQRWRDNTAQTWRRVRRQLRSLTPDQRAAVLKRWSNPWLPKQAHDLADVIHSELKP
jgi:DNA-directed RNA polymerase specialized sigma24 family protein